MTSPDGRDANSDGSSTSTSPDDKPHFSSVVIDAAVQAEFETGRREESVEEAKRSITKRLLKAGIGFTLIGLGAAMIVLPGPGWLMIVAGLTMLPFRWAERTVVLIRQKIPGVPADGRIPGTTWAILGVVTVAITALSILLGDDLSSWARSFGHPDKLFG